MLSTFTKHCVNRLPVYTSFRSHIPKYTTSFRPTLQNRFRQFASEVKSAADIEAKYADKLKEAAKKRGLTVEELKAKVLEEAKQRRQAANPVKKPTKTAAASKSTSADKVAATVTAKAKQPYDSSAPTLDKIVKLELLEKEDTETIEKIWTQYHADKDCITAIIPSDIYDTLYKRSQEYPMFIVPMPRETGIEFFVMQFRFHQCHFTSLLEYKTKGTEARPFFTITHFPELATSKGIVLMRGEISDEPRMIDTQNAQFLAFTLQQFYATGNETKFNMVEKFHKAPQDFDYQALINEVERVI
ncbi:ATP11 protein-domain-containing protein [Halteromyces radiatus]|uniref:ATP11 protein-domain-containing protein n=1 Tax=Halteromyces radiatus TaxID=101107 RepID=UPI00221EF940|nr:ATP11 protein-domain-containing protein [Halteromyces radiatus]KAI8099643.1 ATP11 protein-domain-containing protein [Halteromyces radiatus]